MGLILNIYFKKEYISHLRESIRVIIKTDDGIFSFISPIGSSTGIYELKPFPYKNLDKSIYFLRSFFKDFKNKHVDFFEWEEFIRENVHKIGSSIALALSVSFFKSLIKENEDNFKLITPSNHKKTKTRLLVKIFGGGKHSFNPHSFQEFLVFTKDKISVREQVYNIREVYLNFREKFKNNLIDLEGGIVLDQQPHKILDLLEKEDFNIGLDIAASSLYKENKYFLMDKSYSPEEFLNYLEYLADFYNIQYLEDPFYEEDKIIHNFRRDLIILDDLFGGNLNILKERIKWYNVKGVIIKINQLYSLLNLKKALELINKYEKWAVFSHRSIETCDPFLGDLVNYFKPHLFKISLFGCERLEKINRLL